MDPSKQPREVCGMTKKQLRKAVIRMQNNAAKRGGHIPSVAYCRQVILTKEAQDNEQS